jgi:hypothetical protein
MYATSVQPFLSLSLTLMCIYTYTLYPYSPILTLIVGVDTLALAGPVGKNALVRILEKIPEADVKMLQASVLRTSRTYRYYTYNKTMEAIPTSSHVLPDGGAIEMLARILSEKKEKGIVLTNTKCQVTTGSSVNRICIRSSPHLHI